MLILYRSLMLETAMLLLAAVSNQRRSERRKVSDLTTSTSSTIQSSLLLFPSFPDLDRLENEALLRSSSSATDEI